MALLTIVSSPTSISLDLKFLSSLICEHSLPMMPYPKLLYRNLSPFSEPAISQSLSMLFLLYEMLFLLKCLLDLHTFSKTQHKYYFSVKTFLTPLLFFRLCKRTNMYIIICLLMFLYKKIFFLMVEIIFPIHHLMPIPKQVLRKCELNGYVLSLPYINCHLEQCTISVIFVAACFNTF